MKWVIVLNTVDMLSILVSHFSFFKIYLKDSPKLILNF